MTIRYINTDLDVESEFDLTGLAAALEAEGMYCLHVERGDDRRWRACFETNTQYGEVEDNISAILDAVESLRGDAIETWQTSSVREFNIGFNSGVSPRAFEQGLSNVLLHRIAGIRARIGITIYAASDE